MQNNSFKNLFILAGQKRYLLFLACLFATFHAILNLAPYFITYEILKSVSLNSFDFNLLKEYLFYAFYGIALSYFFLYASLIFSHLAAYEILYQLRVLLIEKISRLSFGYFQKLSKASIKKVVIDDVEKIEKFIAHNLIDIVKALVMPITIIVYMFYIDVKLALVSLIPLFVFVLWLFVVFFTKNLAKVTDDYYQSSNILEGVVLEYIRSLHIMKVFNQDIKSFKNYTNTINTYTSNILIYIKKNSPFYGTIMSFLSNSVLPILAFGLYFYSNEQITLWVFLFFLILGVAYLKPALAISTIGNNIYIMSQGVNEIVKFLDEGVELQDTKKEQKLKNFDISISNLSFSYENKEVLKDINLEIKEGERVAFIGKSGVGKSTLAALIPRFFEAQEGQIKIGGVDIKDMAYESLLKNISFVFQDNFLFADTIRNNITMDKKVKDQELIAATKVARAYDFIKELPSGFDSEYSKKGLDLSGGQIQRLELARVVLKDSPILILDEATAFFDAVNEYKILQALKDITKDKTVIMIAHKLKSVIDADKIVFFDEGKIEAIGVYEELISNKKFQEYIKEEEYGTD